MRLTKKKAIEISIELWTWLAETGKEKWEWSGWKKYGHMLCNCALCEYDNRACERLGGEWCSHCPYYKRFGDCQGEEEFTAYANWAEAETEEERKKYAALFLEQLKQL